MIGAIRTRSFRSSDDDWGGPSTEPVLSGVEVLGTTSGQVFVNEMRATLARLKRAWLIIDAVSDPLR